MPKPPSKKTSRGPTPVSGATLAPTLNATATVSSSLAATALGPATGTIVQVPPLVQLQSPLTSLFDAAKPGKPVVRPDDLLALRIELVNLKVTPAAKPGADPTLARAGSGDAFITLHFPPQSICEQVFFEKAPPGDGMSTPDVPPLPNGITTPANPADTGVAPPPIRARVAGESRLVFKVPDGFTAPYTLAGVLAACEQLALNVPANALPRSTPFDIFVPPGLLTAGALAKLPASQRVALSGLALRSAQLAALAGPSSTALAARVSQVGTAFDPSLVPFRPPVFRVKPKPGLPTPQQTAIELPWRLIIAPHGGERFRHASQPVTSPLTNRTELWHTRLVAPDSKGAVIEPPHDDANRTLRAVWALTGEGSDLPAHPMKPDFLTAADLPRNDQPTGPFLSTLDDFDRYQIAHLSSNFSVTGYDPQPLDAKLLMLSSLGGWLDARGAWEPPGLSVEEWVHRASMGRDHYVRVVYKGFLYPFGHRVALVKVSERKFHNGRNNTSKQPGNAAYLRQRMFIVVRERERSYVDPGLFSADGQRSFQRQFPFNSVRILTAVTPNLDPPTSAASIINRPAFDAAPPSTSFGQSMFWPAVNGVPFAFRCVGTDIDGRRAQFELPLIFMDNSLASPRKRVTAGSTTKLVPVFADETVAGKLVRGAETHARAATAEWLARSDASGPRRVVDLKRQRVALAPSLKAGDTAVEVEKLDLGGEWQAQNNGLRSYSQNLSRPVFYPSVQSIRARVAATAQLTGSGGNNLLNWNAAYLKDGFDAPDVAPAAAKNKSAVFVEITQESGMAQLDFSSQGDRSGGFVMPNLKPSGLSRKLGPLTGPVDKFVSGASLPGTEMFPSTGLGDLPLPLLFGCIPLGEILTAIAGGSDKLPKFASEASSKLEAFFNTLTRAYGFVQQLGSQSGSLAQAAIDVIKGMATDLLAQAQALAAAEVAQVKAALNQVLSKLDALRALFQKFNDLPSIDDLLAELKKSGNKLSNDVTGGINDVIAEVENLRTQVQGASLPSGFKQTVLSNVNTALTFLNDVKAVLALVQAGADVFADLKAIVEDPTIFTTAGALKPKLDALTPHVGSLRNAVATQRLLDGAPAKTVLAALDAMKDVLDKAAGPIEDLLDSLLGEELVIHFDWSPEIKSWGFVTEADGSVKPENQLFRANDPHGFVVGVEARVKKSGGTPKVSVLCGLKHFDLVLIAPAAFLELNFEKIEFSVDSSAKMNVDVLLSDIKFVGPLSFVETLKDLIPLDGFSDPPYLDISPSGIDAGFSLSLPNIAVGMFSLTNLSLGAGFTVPFIGQPLSVRFNFCTREQPFNLTVSLFGGGGFFGVTIDPHGVQILEAAFEFGASISVDFGVASGGVHVMAGVYFRMEKDAASLTGYFRLGGHVSVLGIISASLELYLELRYEFSTGKCVGKAELTIEVSIFMFSISVKITCERKFAGSNGDPSFRELMGFDPSPTLTLADELNKIDDSTDYAWREYVEAFA